MVSCFATLRPEDVHGHLVAVDEEGAVDEEVGIAGAFEEQAE